MSRPIPTDFAQFCQTEGVTALARRYRTAKLTILGWFAQSGIARPKLLGGTPMRPIPDDFAAVQHGRTNSWLRIHYGCGEEAVTRWRKALNLPVTTAPPDDFAQRYAEMTINQLRSHYGRGWTVIKQWINELGLKRPVPNPQEKKHRPSRAKAASFIRAAPEARNPRARLVVFHRAAPDPIIRDMSPAAQAADYLRHFGPVYRCDDRGRPSLSGKLWRRGNAVMTDAELIERAEWLRGKQAA